MTAADRPTVTPRVGDPITTGGELGALPGVRVIVDPDDETGDAPVVLCRASDGPWAALTTGLLIGKGWWTSTEIASAAKSVRVVYIPGEQSRPSVTDDARAEAERRYPSDVADRGLTYPTGAVREHSQAAFVAGAEWAAGRAETPAGLTVSEDGSVLNWQGVNYVPQRAETTTATPEDAARVLYESGTGFKLTEGKPWEELAESSRNSQRRLAQALADAGLLATARTRPTDTTKETS